MAAKEEDSAKHIADIVGEWGKWQRHLVCYCFLLWAASALNNMGYTFHSYNVDFWCSDVPIHYPFDLVCDRSNLASMTQSFFMLGFMVSGLIFSYYSDKYGRRPVVFVSFTFDILALISSLLSVNITQYSISRFFNGMGESGRWLAMYTILLECSGPKHRSNISVFVNTGWVLGYAIIPGLAFLLKNFRYMQLCSVIIMNFMMIWFYFFYESPRWQLTNGQMDRAEITIKKALKQNGKSDKNFKKQLFELAEHLQRLKDDEKSQKSMTILDLLKRPKLRKSTLIIWYSWFANSLVYYGFSFNMSDFGGNFYITFFLSGLVELPASLFTAIALRYFGRKKLFSFFMLLITLSTLAVIPSKTTVFKVTFALLGKFAVSSAWCVMLLHGPEVFPTVIRHIGIGSSSVVGRMGSMASPFMKNLAANTSLTVVMMFYAILAAIGVILGLFLPETKGLEIPDTIEEAENLGTHEMKTIETIEKS